MKSLYEGDAEGALGQNHADFYEVQAESESSADHVGQPVHQRSHTRGHLAADAKQGVRLDELRELFLPWAHLQASGRGRSGTS